MPQDVGALSSASSPNHATLRVIKSARRAKPLAEPSRTSDSCISSQNNFSSRISGAPRWPADAPVLSRGAQSKKATSPYEQRTLTARLQSLVTY
jgi:hypothetical protein